MKKLFEILDDNKLLRNKISTNAGIKKGKILDFEYSSKIIVKF